MEARVSSAFGKRVEPLTPSGRALLGALLLLSSLLLVVEPGRIPLFEPDEGRYAEIPREMLAAGDLVTPRLDGVLYFEKPPLHYWSVALAFRLFGESEGVSRIPIKAAALGMVLLTFAFARRRHGERVAFLAALVVSTSLLVVSLARVNLIDPSLSLALSGATFAFCAFQEADRSGDRVRARLALYGFHLACAAAVMLKGLVGLVLPGGAILVWAFLVRRLNVVPRLFAPGPLVLFLLLTVPWHVALARREGDFLGFYFVHEHFDRFFKSDHKRTGSPFYFVAVLLGGLLPWTGFLGRVAGSWPGRVLSAWRERQTEAFLWVYSILLFLFFSASKSKLIPYLEPIWPTVAVLLAIGIERARVRGASFGLDRALTAALFGALFAVGLAFGFGAGHAARFGVVPQAVLTLGGLLVGFLVNLPWRQRAAPGSPRSVSTERLVLVLLVPWSLFIAGAVLALPGVARAITPWPLVERLLAELKPGDVLLQRGHYLQVVPFYAKRLTPITDLGWNELNFGQAHAAGSGLFPTPAEFARTWNGPRRVLVVVHHDHLRAWNRTDFPLSPPIVLARTPNGKYHLLANRPADAPGPASPEPTAGPGGASQGKPE